MKKRLSLFVLFLLVTLSGLTANAGILWVGGEDIDFPIGGAVCMNTGAAFFRSGFSRGGIFMCNAASQAYSNPFPGGPVTSFWFSVQIANFNCNTQYVHVGLMRSGGTGFLGIGVGTNSGYQIALWDSANGMAWNRLAQEAGASYLVGTTTKIDMQVISYGTTGTVNIYAHGGAAPVISYTGNIAPGSATNLDSVAIYGGEQGCGTEAAASEIIVSSTDTRNLALATLAPNAAGDSDTFTSGTFSTINPTTASISTYASDNNSGDILQCKTNAPPAGNYTVPMVKVSASSSMGVGGIASLSVGIKTNGSANNPAAVTQTGSWNTEETFYPSNPTTSSSWLTTDFTNFQISLQSAP